jgi:ubiquinone/menaquinone biosynthesis C-methylase UbiE
MPYQNIQTLPKEPEYLETADIETASEDYAMRFSGDIGKYFLSVQTDLTLGMLKNYQIKTILDVGGGHAQVTIPLVKNGYEVTVAGSDESCRKRLDRFLEFDQFEFRVCDILDLPFEENSFDAVLAFRLLPHVCRWKSLIQEMCRVSNKIVIIDYPDIRSFNIFYKLMFRIKKMLEGNTRPFTLFSRNQILRELNKQGFGNIIYKPEFFMPMVLHRLLKSVSFAKTSEYLFRTIGLTRFLGSPIILGAEKLTSSNFS